MGPFPRWLLDLTEIPERNSAHETRYSQDSDDRLPWSSLEGTYHLTQRLLQEQPMLREHKDL